MQDVERKNVHFKILEKLQSTFILFITLSTSYSERLFVIYLRYYYRFCLITFRPVNDTSMEYVKYPSKALYTPYILWYCRVTSALTDAKLDSAKVK